MSNDWIVRGIRMGNSNGWAGRSRLILDVEPSCGNLKKYQGEMEFIIDPEQMRVLRQVVAEESEKERRLEIAKTELDDMEAEQLESLKAKRKELRASLGLEGDPDLPYWLQN